MVQSLSDLFTDLSKRHPTRFSGEHDYWNNTISLLYQRSKLKGMSEEEFGHRVLYVILRDTAKGKMITPLSLDRSFSFDRSVYDTNLDVIDLRIKLFLSHEYRDVESSKIIQEVREHLDVFEFGEEQTFKIKKEVKQTITGDQLLDYLDEYLDKFVDEHKYDLVDLIHRLGVDTDQLTREEEKRLRLTLGIVVFSYELVRYGGMLDIAYLFVEERNKSMDSFVTPQDMLNSLSKGVQIDGRRYDGYGDCDEFAMFFAYLVKEFSKREHVDINVIPQYVSFGNHVAIEVDFPVGDEKLPLLFDLTLGYFDVYESRIPIQDRLVSRKKKREFTSYQKKLEQYISETDSSKVQFSEERVEEMLEKVNRYYRLSIPLFELLRDYKRYKYGFKVNEEIFTAGRDYPMMYTFLRTPHVYQTSFSYLLYPLAKRKRRGLFGLFKYELKDVDKRFLADYLTVRSISRGIIKKESFEDVYERMYKFLSDTSRPTRVRLAYYVIFLTNPELVRNESTYQTALNRLDTLSSEWEKLSIDLYDLLLSVGPLEPLRKRGWKGIKVLDFLSPENSKKLYSYITDHVLDTLNPKRIDLELPASPLPKRDDKEVKEIITDVLTKLSGEGHAG